MIQELLRGGGGGGGGGGCGGGAEIVLGGATERKFSINCGVFEGSVSSTTNTTTTHFNTSSSTTQTPLPLPLPLPPPQTITTNTTSSSNPNPNFPTSAAVASDQQNLRCPRCDSSNTKFCYYNNYNLTQPRHFCKTCRRYWTKGGALRNVPIGGGCRKNKSSIVSTTGPVKSSAGKVKAGSPDIVKSALGFGFDHDHPPSSITNPILWPSPQNSHLLALLRATSQNPNPNPNPLKEDGNMIGSHHHMISSSDQHSIAVSGALNARSLSLDPMSSTTSHVPMSLCSSFWRNYQNQNQNHQQQHQQHHHQQQQQQNHHQQQSFLVGHEVQNSGIQELYQRLRSSTNYYSDHSPAANNVISTSAATSTSILEPSSVAGAAELGYWNPSFSWSNLSTTNGCDEKMSCIKH